MARPSRKVAALILASRTHRSPLHFKADMLLRRHLSTPPPPSFLGNDVSQSSNTFMKYCTLLESHSVTVHDLALHSLHPREDLVETQQKEKPGYGRKTDHTDQKHAGGYWVCRWLYGMDVAMCRASGYER